MSITSEGFDSGVEEEGRVLVVEQGQPIGEGLLEKKQEVEVVCMGEAGKADEQSKEARPTHELKQVSEVSDTLRRAGGEIALEEEDGRSAG